MMAGAVLAAATNLMFILLAWRGHDVPFMYLAVGFDGGAGLAGAVFIAFIGAHQHPLHRRSICDFQLADDAAAQNLGRLFRLDCR